MSEEKFDDAFFTWFGVCAIPAILALLFLGGEPWWERATGLDFGSSMSILFFLGLAIVWLCGRFQGWTKRQETAEDARHEDAPKGNTR